MLLDHSAGLPALRAKLAPGSFLDWDLMVELLAKEAPFWVPGSAHGYQMTTHGWLVGEIVRRVTGVPGQFFNEQFAQPLGLDFWIGLPDEEHHRVTRLKGAKPVRGEAVPQFTKALLDDAPVFRRLRSSILGSLERMIRRATDGIWCRWWDYERPSTGATLCTAGGWWQLGGTRFFSESAIDQMSKTWVAGADQTLCMPSHFGLGLMKSMDNTYRPSGAFESCVIGQHAFGHAGAGGSMGFADPAFGFSFGYTMNQMGPGILLNERGQALVDAIYSVNGAADRCWRLSLSIVSLEQPQACRASKTPGAPAT